MNLKQTLLLTSLSVICLTQSALAVQEPRSLATDERIKVVAYQADNVVPVRGTTFTTTQVVFGDAEHIVDVEGGDAAAWTINIDKYLPNTLNIKPTILGSDSNLTVVTLNNENHRKNYYFHLTSNKTVDKADHQTFAVHFKYPDEEKAKLLKQLDFEKQQKKAIVNASKNPKDYNWDYSFNGDRSIMPLHVFDDGKFTYLQLRDDQDIPAIFSVKNKQGEESVVNYRREGHTVVILQVSPQFTLRAGQHSVASLFNNKAITKIRRYS